jgi:hypothetical protein
MYYISHDGVDGDLQSRLERIRLDGAGATVTEDSGEMVLWWIERLSDLMGDIEDFILYSQQRYGQQSEMDWVPIVDGLIRQLGNGTHLGDLIDELTQICNRNGRSFEWIAKEQDWRGVPVTLIKGSLNEWRAAGNSPGLLNI